MSKGKWHSTRNSMHLARNILLLAPPGTYTRAKLVKAVMGKKEISYHSANYAVNKASIQWMSLFESHLENGHEPYLLDDGSLQWRKGGN